MTAPAGSPDAGRPRRIGLYGGSFDPVHTAHLALARTALAHLRLDCLHWVPAGQPWQKAGQPMAPAEDRAAMVALAIAGEPRFQLDRREVDRPGPSFTIDTVTDLQQQAPGAEVYLVIGQDQFARFATWHRWQALLQRVTLAVAGRDGAPARAPAALQAVPHRIEVLPLPPTPVSATAIRARLRAGGTAQALVPGMVPAEVARYIDRHALYAAGGAESPPA